MELVGDPATTWPAVTQDALYYDLAFHPTTYEPYVSWAGSFSGSKTSGVVRYDGNNWVTVGDGSINEVNSNWSCEMAFSPVTSQLYLACSGATNWYPPRVVKWDGASWTQVGPDVISSNKAALAIKIAFKPGTDIPYIAYADANNSNRPTVKKLSGNQWVNVGTGVISTSGSDYLSMAFHPSDGTLYVGYKDTSNSNRATVYQIATN